MKELIRKVISCLILFWFYLYSYKISKLIRLRYNQLYSMWISNAFNTVGTNFFIESPLYLNGSKNIYIGKNFNAGLRLRLETYNEHLGLRFSPRIIIGDNVSINSDCHIGAINEIIINDGVLIASKVFITDHYHGHITNEALIEPPYARKLQSKGAVIIEKNVWVGEGVVILPNVTIGENSIIGANSVITKNIPKNSVVGGNPAKIIRTL